MKDSPVNRRLAAILAADVVGYSRLMAEDEEATLRTLNIYRAAIADLVAEHGGRIFGKAGDSVIVEFASAVNAVRAAVAIQRALDRRNADLPKGKRMEFRLGINVGDVIVEGDDLMGDGVNVAARLQEIASPAGICISGSVHDQIVGKMQFAFSPLGEHLLKNIPRQLQVWLVDWSVKRAVESEVLEGRAPTLPDRPSIAVLPFQNMSGDAEQEYFADGITEDIITALSHYRWFFVIARNSTFAYKGRPGVDVKQVARELGVRYVLEGSVRKAGNRIRATAQLVEAESGNHLWAEKFDRDLTDIFVIQDEITQSVVGAIEPEIQLGEERRATRKSAVNLDAFDCGMRGSWHFQQFTREDNQRAEVWMRRAIALDPNLAQGHLGLTRTLNIRIWWGWSDDIDRDLAEAYASAKRAVTLDERDPYSHYALCLASMLMLRHEQSLAEAQRSIDLNPNFALGYFALGWIRIYLGHAAEAVDPILQSLRLSPNERQRNLQLGWLALAQYHQGKYEEAIRSAERSQLGRTHEAAPRTLLASLGQLGRIEEAKPLLAELEQFRKTTSERHWQITLPYADPASRAHFIEGLRKAGMNI
jgi:TolB-like protein/class 3 adenylate cyclase